MPWDSSVRQIKGVGPKRAELFQAIGIRTIGDVLRHFPRSYADRSVLSTLAAAEQDCRVTVRGIVESVRQAPSYGAPSKSPMKVVVSDGTSRAEILFFNAKFLKGSFQVGETYFFHGVLKREGRMPVMMHPEFCKEADWQQFSALTPLYPLTAGLTQTDLRNLTGAVLDLGLTIPETLPETLIEEQHLMSSAAAYHTIHRPMSWELAESARRRFAFEELYLTQLALFYIKRDVAAAEKSHAYGAPSLLDRLLEMLPYELTQGQQTVLGEILEDMRSPRLMNRLVQGDVGSGKTVLALAAACYAALSGHQAAVMAPTELLARQHHRFFAALLEPLGIRTGLLVGGGKERSDNLALLENGTLQVAIGTHALIQDAVRFKDLTLVITDEQHRFGVRQRSQLARKSKDHPDILFMSATPIPRTLSLILYGDVEVSYLREMPVGRIPVKTHYVRESKRQDMYRFISGQLDAGHQAFVVCPLVADSEEVQAVSAEAHYDVLRTGPFKGRQLGLIHGKMKLQDKEAVMRRFVGGEIGLLVSTTVIEVGVDVPAATVMVIEDSDRFGLAQLHQLRGRVGRGDQPSWCFLMSNSSGKVAQERIKTLTGTTDGFVIAQKDLELRGPGEILGTRQHGLPELKAANLLTDGDLLALAQEQALKTFKEDRLTPSERHYLSAFIRDFSV